MTKDFNDIYNETYFNFYNMCNQKELISNNPIPYMLKEDAKTIGEYKNDTIIIQNNLASKSDINIIKSTLCHEFTHYYDENVFKNCGYLEKDIEILMLTFSEIHASYNSIFAFFNINNSSINNRIKMDKVVYNGYKLSQLCNSNVNSFINKMNNILGFKYSMYLLGEKRAMLKISSNPIEINRIYSNTKIPRLIRDEIIAIDKMVIFDSPQNIDISELSIHKLKAETELMKNSIDNLKPLPHIEGMDEINNFLNSLKS